MDVQDSPADTAFRDAARAWLADHAPARHGPERGRGTLAQGDADAAAAHVRAAQAWQARLADAGWAGVAWPTAFGGRGGTAHQQAIFDEEQARFDVPHGVFTQGLKLVGPTLITHGTPAQQQRYLSPILRGDEVWCQLFSEPDAGSDLASLSTRAVRDGDDFVITGQKVWTSSAQFAHHGILLARTDPDAARHRGITCFLVDMHSPGVVVRPLRQITGVAHFNEVFLTEVRVPADQVLGPVGDGWRVALSTLSNERVAIGGSGIAAVGAELAAAARGSGRDGDRVLRQQVVDVHIRSQIIRYLGWRAQTAAERGDPPGPESSVLKLASSRLQERMGDAGIAAVGAHGMLLDYTALDDDRAIWPGRFLMQWAPRLGGGTEQVQRNVIAERILGLPREPRPSPSP